MYTSASDDDVKSSNSVNTTNLMDSTYEMQILAEARGEQLQEDYTQLLKEMNVLKAQFDQVLSISKNSEQVHKENEKLKAEIRNLQSEKEDLSNRIDICIKSREEALRQLEIEKHTNLSQRESDLATLQKDFNKAKKSYKEQIEELCTQLSELQNIRKEEEIEQKTLESKLRKMLLAASHFTNREFASIDEFTDFMETESIQNINLPVQNNIERCKESAVDKCKCYEFERKIRKIKSQLKDALKRNMDLDTELESSKRELHNMKSKYSHELDELQLRLTNAASVNEEKISMYMQQIANLESKVESQRQELIKAKESKVKTVYVDRPAAPQSSKTEIQLPSYQGHIHDDIYEQLNARINELNKQVSSVTKQRDSLTDELKSHERKFMECKMQAEKDRSDLTALKAMHSEAQAELNTLRTALHNKEQHMDKKLELLHKKEINKSQAKIMSLSSSLETLKQQNYDLQLEKEKVAKNLRDKSNELSQKNQEAEDLKDQLARANSELTDMRFKLSEKPVINEDEIIPRVSWHFSEFEQSLISAIDKIVVNPSLRLPSKLQQVMKTIYKHYKKQLDKRTEAVQEIELANKSVMGILDKFIINMSIALTESGVTSEDFLNNCEIRNNMLQAISQMKTSYMEEKRRREALQSIIDNFTEAFGVCDSRDINQQILCIKNETESNLLALEKKKKKYKKLKNAFEIMQKRFESDCREYELEVSDLKNRISSLKLEKQKLNDHVKHLTSENNDYLETSKAYESKYAQLSIAKNEMKEAIKEKMHMEFSRKLNDLQDEVQRLNCELDRANVSLAEAESTILRYKKTLSTQKETIKERDEEIEAMKADFSLKEKSDVDRLKLEKQQMIDGYETTVKELTEQCEKYKSDTARLSSQLSQAQKLSKEAKNAVVQLRRENNRLEKLNQTQLEQYNREKRLSDTTAKNAAMSAESEYTAKLNEMRTRFEAEKRKLIANAVDEFRQFFNANDVIDERSYRCVICKAREELARLTKTDASIRRMVGATPQQSTDDAVAQFLMGTNC